MKMYDTPLYLPDSHSYPVRPRCHLVLSHGDSQCCLGVGNRLLESYRHNNITRKWPWRHRSNGLHGLTSDGCWSRLSLLLAGKCDLVLVSFKFVEGDRCVFRCLDQNFQGDAAPTCCERCMISRFQALCFCLRLCLRLCLKKAPCVHRARVR